MGSLLASLGIPIAKSLLSGLLTPDKDKGSIPLADYVGKFVNWLEGLASRVETKVDISRNPLSAISDTFEQWVPSGKEKEAIAAITMELEARKLWRSLGVPKNLNDFSKER